MTRIPGEDPDEPLAWRSRLVLMVATIAVIATVAFFLIDAVIG